MKILRITSFTTWFLILLSSYAYGSSNVAPTQRVNIYGWAEYISTVTLKDFEKKTGIIPFYDVYDSENIMHAKLLSKATGYDIVLPSNCEYLSYHIKLGLYLPIDRSKLPNYKNLDEPILKILRASDPENKYTIPWMYTATGIGYDIDKIKEIDPNAPLDSLEIIFNPEYAKKFEQCGIYWFNFGPEMIGLALLYLGKDPNDTDPHNLALAAQTIKSVKKYVRAISNTAYMDFESHNICLTVGWAAEIAQHMASLKFSKELSQKKFTIILPKEGFFVGVDTLAIPRNAKNVDSAYKFINYLLEPQVAAYNSNNYTKHMNANKASYHLLDVDILKNNALNIPPNIIQKSGRALEPKSQEFTRTRNRTWALILSE